jgi:recombination protein RecR
MSNLYPSAMRRLINELTKLPSIGEKSAARLAYHLLTDGRNTSVALVDILREATEKTVLCQFCYFLSESSLCPICANPARDRALLCVVEKPADVVALEQSGGYHGLYHVLHGVWSPIRGISPEQTRIGDLLRRLHNKERGEDPLRPEVEEIILATSTTVEGDATALYIASSIEGLHIPVTRIAQGLPKGGELEYADQMTLHLSLEGRRKL